MTIEAIASSLPVVTSNRPPFTEFLTPEQALLIDSTSVYLGKFGSDALTTLPEKSCQPLNH